MNTFVLRTRPAGGLVGALIGGEFGGWPVWMRLTIVALLGAAAFAGPAQAKPIDVEFRGILDLGASRIFSLSTDAGARTAWVEEGDLFAGYEVVQFRPDENVLILRKEGEEFALSLGSAKIIRGDIHSDAARVDVSNLRQIGQASLIFANDNRERLPGGEGVETIHDVARLLARGAGLNTASMWVSASDARSGSEDRLTTVVENRGKTLSPVFAEQDIVAFDFATGLDTKMRSTTPIAWTRGLREDGTWDPRGVYGSSGGFVVFLGGNVATYEELSREGGPRLKRPDGTPTNNILEALPTEARVVGAGPGTLHGSTGLHREDGRE